MIKFSNEKVKLLHKLMAEATGGSVGVRDEDIVAMGLGVADGSMNQDDIHSWTMEHRKL